MATLQEMLNGFGVVITGYAKSVDEYVSRKDPANPKSYWSVTVEAGGALPWKIDIPPNYDKSKIQINVPARFDCIITNKFKESHLELKA